MTPTSFSFTLTVPGDERFVGAIRLLAAQAATYANLPAETGAALADEVQRATEALMRSAASPDVPIDCTFAGEGHLLKVQLASPTTAAAPASTAADGRTVDWSADGARLTCSIHQHTSA
jgi:hypothetical protein